MLPLGSRFDKLIKTSPTLEYIKSLVSKIILVLGQTGSNLIKEKIGILFYD